MSVVRFPGKPNKEWTVKPTQIDAIDFISSEEIHIKGLSLLGSSSGSASHSGCIQLKETSSQVLITSANFTFSSDGESGFYDQVFSSPQSVKAHKKYTVTVEYFAHHTIQAFTSVGLPKVSAVCKELTVNFAFSKSSDDNNSTGPKSGQIPRILFYC